MPLINIALTVLIVQAVRYLLFDHGVLEFAWRPLRKVPVVKTFLSCPFCQGFWLGLIAFLPQVAPLLAVGWGLVSGFLSASWSKRRPTSSNVAENKNVDDCPKKTDTDEVCLLECNIDDMSGEFFGDIMERLFMASVLDVWFTSAYGKKNRPLYQLSVLCRPEDEDKAIREILTHSSTAGIRRRMVERIIMDRSFIKVVIDGEFIAVKKLVWQDIVKYTPEWDDCAKVAKKLNKQVAEIYSQAQAMAREEIVPKGA